MPQYNVSIISIKQDETFKYHNIIDVAMFNSNEHILTQVIETEDKTIITAYNVDPEIDICLYENLIEVIQQEFDNGNRKEFTDPDYKPFLVAI